MGGVTDNPDAATLAEICDALRSAWQECKTSDERAHLCNTLTKAKMLRDRAAKQDPPTIVFSLDAPGFVSIGWDGEVISTYPLPKCSTGLEHGWDIFTHGVNGNGILSAGMYCPGKRRPGNTLRNQLNNAAQWLETVANFPELAKAFSPPCISVSDSGPITYNPSLHLPIKLTML